MASIITPQIFRLTPIFFFDTPASLCSTAAIGWVVLIMKTAFRRQFIYALCLAAVLLVSGCNKSAEVQAPEPPQVSVMTLIESKVDLTEDLPGRVSAVRTAEIRAQVSGIVQRRLFEQGAEVKAGQPLFQINAAPFKADAARAAAALQRVEAMRNQARVKEERLRPLVGAEAVSRQLYDDAVSKRRQAAAEVAEARAALARKQLDIKFAAVDAPISGRIGEALRTEGALVGPADTHPMARIQKIDQVYVDVRQPASMLESLRDEMMSKSTTENQGLSVGILRSNGQPYPVHGRILFSGVNVDAGTGEVLLRIAVDNRQRHLLPGMFVRARVPRVSYSDALMVPQQAVVRAGEGTQVWIVDDANKARATNVQLGELIDRQYRIIAGLHAGQKLVIEGMERLSEGGNVSARSWLAPDRPQAAVSASAPLRADTLENH